MYPRRGPWGIGTFTYYRNWLMYFKTFRTRVFAYFVAQLFEFEGRGFLFLTWCLWRRAFQIQMPFPTDKILARGSWRFPRHPLHSIAEPKR